MWKGSSWQLPTPALHILRCRHLSSDYGTVFKVRISPTAKSLVGKTLAWHWTVHHTHFSKSESPVFSDNPMPETFRIE